VQRALGRGTVARYILTQLRPSGRTQRILTLRGNKRNFLDVAGVKKFGILANVNVMDKKC
jgi:hypothetical protein